MSEVDAGDRIVLHLGESCAIGQTFRRLLGAGLRILNDLHQHPAGIRQVAEVADSQSQITDHLAAQIRIR